MQTESCICFRGLFLSIFLALFAAVAAVADDMGPVVSAEGRLTGAYQDDLDEAFVFLVLERDGGFTYAFIMTNDTANALKELQPLVGRTIALSGHEITPTIINRAVTKRQISVSSLADIRIASGEDCDPFAVPSLSEAPPSLDELAAPTPRKVAGTIIARWQNKAILRVAAVESIMLEFRDGIDIPAVGESIEAAGTPVTDLYRIHLDEAIWKKSNEAPAKPDKAEDTPLEDIFRHHGVFIMNPRFFGQTLRVKGMLREFVTDENGNKRLLLENNGFTIQIDCSNAPDASMIELGSVVSATGVCVLDSDIWRPSAPFPKNKSLFLVARGPDDIVVLKRPPWWTPAKFIAAASVMGGVIVLILIWNASLRVLVRRRTREAIKAQERKLESELRVAERTRLAADLHDSFSQNLSVIGYHVAALQTSLAGADEASSGRLSTVAKMIKSCLIDLRRCLWDLRNDVLDEPNFAEAIRRTVEPVARDAELHIRFDGRRALLSDATAHALLNVVRELVANAVAHGGAKNVRIVGDIHADGMSLSVRDDGCGFDPEKRPGTGEGHFGIDGIKARLERIGGTLAIESSPGKGTKVAVDISMSRSSRSSQSNT